MAWNYQHIFLRLGMSVQVVRAAEWLLVTSLGHATYPGAHSCCSFFPDLLLTTSSSWCQFETNGGRKAPVVHKNSLQSNGFGEQDPTPHGPCHPQRYPVGSQWLGMATANFRFSLIRWYWIWWDIVLLNLRCPWTSYILFIQNVHSSPRSS